MNSLSDSFWRDGLSMDSSIFSDDDFLDWRWPSSSPRRCDREGAMLGMDYWTHRNDIAGTSSSCSSTSSSSSSSNIEELFFYCTEELGSESTSGVVDFCISPIDATTSGRSTYEDYNWAVKHQACVSSTCTKSTSHSLQDEVAGNIPSHGHIVEANAPHHHHHHCRAISGGVSRSFPPPLASLLSDRPLLRSFKSNGRFILKKVANVSRSLFRSTRKNGCLRLDFLSSSFDCLESQYPLFFPANSAACATGTESIPTIDIDHDSESTPPCYWLGIPSPYSMLHHKSTPNYETMCLPSTVQPFGMLMHSKIPCSYIGEESISTSSTSFQAGHLIKGQAGMNMAMVKSTPHVFALFKLLPSGLGLIIFEIGDSNVGVDIILYGMYILKDLGFQCGSRTAMSPSHHHHLTNSYGISMVSSSEEHKGKLLF